MANPRYDQYGNQDFEGQDNRQGGRNQGQQGRRGQDQYDNRGGFGSQDDRYTHDSSSTQERTAHNQYGRAGGYDEEDRYASRPDDRSQGSRSNQSHEGAYSGSRGSMDRSSADDYARRPGGGAFRSAQTDGQYGRDYAGPGGHGYGYSGQNRDHDRGFFQRAGDEIASWFDTDSGNSHRGKGPQGYSRPDQRIEDDANDRLSDDPMVDASNIRVKVASGEVTLEGEVDSKQAKRIAEDCVDRISGVKHVQNNLRVRQSGQSQSGQSQSGQSMAQSSAVTGQSTSLSDKAIETPPFSGATPTTKDV